MHEHLYRVKARINRGGERPPFGSCHLDEFSPGRVPFNPASQPPELQPQDKQISQEKDQQGGIRAARPEKPLPPFSLSSDLSTALTPAFGQKVQKSIAI